MRGTATTRTPAGRPARLRALTALLVLPATLASMAGCKSLSEKTHTSAGNARPENEEGGAEKTTRQREGLAKFVEGLVGFAVNRAR